MNSKVTSSTVLCDGCSRALRNCKGGHVFPSDDYADKEAASSGWMVVRDNKGVNRHFCPTCRRNRSLLSLFINLPIKKQCQ